MKKIFYFSLIVLTSIIYSCNSSEPNYGNEFQLHGDEASIPSLYFWNGQGDPIISGTARGNYSIEITTTANVSGVFHLGYFEAGRFYKNDIVVKNFTLKKGETFTNSGSFSVYGSIYDSASILVDISTNESSNPARIVKSSVTIQ